MNIEQAYNSWAEQYDTNQNKTRDLDARATIETLAHYAFNSVLELGCGTGKNTAFLMTKASRIIGLDFSQEMLNAAREKITDDRVQFIKADLTKAWEVEDSFADLVTSSLTLEHIADLNHIFEQAHRKLVPGGRFFISELHPFKQYIGSKAKFKTEHGTEELETYTHHISDFVGSAEKNGFKLMALNEWFDEEPAKDMPRLISFVFQKEE